MTRVAIVTGMSKGIGRAIAARLATDGMGIVGCARTEGAAESIASGLRKQGLTAIGLAADVRSAADVDRLVTTAMSELGRVDVLVNNAGIYKLRHFLDITPQEWDETLQTNLTGAFLCARAAARAMIASNAGAAGSARIINIASSLALLAQPESADYNASKTGLILLTQSLTLELARHGILCTSIAPGYVGTEMDADFLGSLTPAELAALNPLGRVAAPEEVANVVAMLCDEQASFVTGATLAVDGGEASTR